MAILRYTVDITGFSGGPGKNVFHARADDANVEQVAQVLSGHLQVFYTALIGKMANGVVFTRGQVIDVESNELVNAGTAWSTAAAAGNPLPRATALVIGWKSSVVARRGMGRTFLGPLGVTMLSTDSTPDATQLAAVQTAADDLVADSQGTVGGAFGVYGYQSALAPGTVRAPDAPRVLRDWVDCAIRDQFAVLRSRRD